MSDTQHDALDDSTAEAAPLENRARRPSFMGEHAETLRQQHDRAYTASEIANLISLGASKEALQKLLTEHHPADIAEALEELPVGTYASVIQRLDPEKRAAVVAERTTSINIAEYAEDESVPRLAEVVEAMSHDDAADLLEHLPLDKVDAIMALLSPEQAEAIRDLRAYEPDTAGGIMTNEFFSVAPDALIKDILDQIGAEYGEVETISEIMVCGRDMKFLGVIHVEDLITGKKKDAPSADVAGHGHAPPPATPTRAHADPHARADSLMERAPVAVTPGTDQEICARFMSKYGLKILPVTDASGRLVGIITIDDIMRVLEEEVMEDIFLMAGIGSKKPFEESTWSRAFKRLPFLAVTLTGMSLLAIIISFFQIALDKVAALSFFIPAIMGLGGNVGIQAATLTVRGISIGEIDFSDFWWMMRRELSVALIISVIVACGLAAVSHGMTTFDIEPPVGAHDSGAATQKSEADPHEEEEGPRSLIDEPFWGFVPRFALTVWLAMFCGILGAVTVGTAVPLICHRIGFDPALASGPFVTMLIDMGTQVIYLSLAMYLLLEWS